MTGRRDVIGLNGWTSYRSRHGMFRAAVRALIEARGVPVNAPRERRRLSEAMREEEPASHLLTPGWGVLVSTSWDRRDWSGLLDRAQAAAAHDGLPHAACVWARGGATINDAYVILTLADWLDVLEAQYKRDGAA